MKKVKLIVAAACVFFAMSASAQGKSIDNSQNKAEKKAKEYLETLKKNVTNVTDDEASKIYPFILDYYKTMADKKSGYHDPKTEQQKRDEKVKGVLTASQYVEFKKPWRIDK